MIRRRTKKILLFLSALFCWLTIIYIIIYLSPTTELMAFLSGLFFLASLTTLTFLFGFSRRIFFFSFGLAVYLLLRFIDMANILNILLLIAILASLEIISREG